MCEQQYSSQTLNRAAYGRVAAPVRIVHLGIGNFTRAHQTWYTEHAPDAGEWGIAGFTGRSARMADILNGQDCLYTLITSGPQHDDCEVISSLSAVHAGSDLAALRMYMADPKVSIVTSTITEAGYMRNRDGDLDLENNLVAHDIAALRNQYHEMELSTVPARIVAGLMARRNSGAGDITILPCDNIAGNGAAFRKVVEQAIACVDESLLQWCDDHVHWASSMVDRITPATTDEDRATVERITSWSDAAPVRTEPFSEWVIQGDFPQGRPQWELAGATITDDVEPYERRKLWMLNGAHTSLAYLGPLFGYESVAQAIQDDTLSTWVGELWDVAGHYLSIPSEEYRTKLIERFSNPRIHHRLIQIATDGSQKLPVRIVPVALRALRDGESIMPMARAVAAWIVFLRRFGENGAQDVRMDEVLPLAQGDDVASVVAYLNKDLASSSIFVGAVAELVKQLSSIQPAAIE